MTVYFVHCEETDAVKIGYAEDAWRRFSKIQSDSPGPLSLLAVEDGDRNREAELHLAFAPFRRRGEWFDFAEPVKRHVAALTPLNKRKTSRALKGALGGWLTLNNVNVEDFAKTVGTSAVSIYRFCSGQHIPGREIMARIYTATGGEVQPNHFYSLPDIEKTELAQVPPDPVATGPRNSAAPARSRPFAGAN
jgi:hypothetical protein